MYSSLKTYPRQPIARNWWCKRFQIQSQVGRCRRGSLMQFKFSCFRIFWQGKEGQFFRKPFTNDICRHFRGFQSVFDGYVTYHLFFNYGTPKVRPASIPPASDPKPTHDPYNSEGYLYDPYGQIVATHPLYILGFPDQVSQYFGSNRPTIRKNWLYPFTSFHINIHIHWYPH